MPGENYKTSIKLIKKDQNKLVIHCYAVGQFSCSVMSDSLQPHELRYAKFPCPSATQTHVHRVRDAIQSSDPLLSPFLPASYRYIMSMCVGKKVYIYIYIYIYKSTDQGLLVKIPKPSDLVPLGSGIIDLCF